MPHETRLIVFNAKEVTEALLDFAIRQGRKIPGKDGAQANYTQEKDGSVKSRLEYGQKEQTAEFTDVETASALIAYCIAHGIPLPRRGQKSVYLRYDELALHVRIAAD